MRNPLDSWDRSDSYISPLNALTIEQFVLGNKDKELSQKLSKAGTEHRKHLRQIDVWANITLPRYVWQEFDTYKYVDKISCSTMHTLMKKEISQSNFEMDIPDDLIKYLNTLIEAYKFASDPDYKRLVKVNVKTCLPEGFLQMRSIKTNYECLLKMHFERQNHELKIWHEIDDWILHLPYFKELTGIE